MSRTRTLRQSLLTAYVLVSLLPLACIALFILLFILQNVRDQFMVKIGLLSQGIRGQIQLFLDQPLTALNTIGAIIAEAGPDTATVTTILNTHSHDSLYFESIYLLNASGKVINAGLPVNREHYRQDLLGIDFAHRRQFKSVLASGKPQWSDTFLSLSSGKISLTLYVPCDDRVLAADINLNALAQMISRLSMAEVVTMVIDRNGAIMFHPDPSLVGQSIMVNDIGLVAAALAGTEQIGRFDFMGTSYLGATSVIEPTGWVALIAEPNQHLRSSLLVPLLIFASGICSAAILSFCLALLQANRLSRPLMEITSTSSVIAQGDYALSLPRSSVKELSQLSDSIAHMASAIRKREKELKDNELKYRELVENTSNLVLRLECDLRIAYANHNIHRLTGFSAAETIGRKIEDFIAAEDWPEMARSIADWTTRRMSSESIQCRMIHADSSISHLLLTVNLHYLENGQLSDLNVIGHDITIRHRLEQQQKEIERQQQQSQKMELLGLMAGGVAHDLNNILAGIINYPELMLLKMEADNPLRHQLELIKKSGERAAAVVADLLTVARDSASVYEVINLNMIIAGYITAPEFQKLQEISPQITFTFIPAPDLWSCACSRTHIEKTLMNLVINAFEAIKTTGEVTVTTANIDKVAIAAITDTLKPADYVAVTVRDSGYGISEEDRARIFEPFFSKKGLGRSGTGLGLTVAWNSVREHGGTIFVDSDADGTVFTVLLPATDAAPSADTQSGEAVNIQGNGEHILVVDDEESLRDIAGNMLKHLGYRVSVAASGEEALTFLETSPADLILLDMQMAPGISGRETFSRIRERHPRQKALVATGFSTSRDVELTLQHGAGAFIKKPYSMVELGRAVNDVLQAEGTSTGNTDCSVISTTSTPA